MAEQPQTRSQQDINDATKIKKYLLIGGVIFIVLGILFIIYGLLGIPGLTGTTTNGMPDGFNQSWDSFNQSYRDAQAQYNAMRNRSFLGFQTGNARIFFFPFGLMMVMVGAVMLYYSQLRRATSYIAAETAPAVTITTHAAGQGLMTGITDAGGIKINTVGSDATTEIIKIKCRHCGYHESIDAEFCSNCGNKI